MTVNAMLYSLSRRQEMFGPSKSILRTKAQYSLIDLVRPDGYWPMPYSIEQAFGIWAWMCATAYKYTRTPIDHIYGKSGPLDLLSKKPTCVNTSQVDPIISIDDLRRRFHYALLSAHASHHANIWREKNRVSINRTLILHFPHFKPFQGPHSEAEIQKRLSALLGATGKIKRQLNKYHAAAKNIVSIEIHCGTGFEFDLHFGYDGSWWRHTLATGKQFIPTMEAAEKALADLRDGK